MGALVGALFAWSAVADPEVTPDPLRNPGAVTGEAKVEEAAGHRALKLDYSALPVALRIVLPPPSAEEKQSLTRRAAKGPAMVGYHRDVPAGFKGDLSAQLDWLELSDGAFVSSLSVTSPGAESLRVGIRAELGPEGEIRFFGEASDERFPVITREDFHIEGDEIQTLWSPSVDGDTIGIEITLPSEKAMGVFSLVIDAVAHTLIPIASLPVAPKLDCPGLHIDVACRAGSIDQTVLNAVAHIRYEKGNRTYICSGTLLNDRVGATAIPYFLTADHCVDSGAVARTMEAYWFFQAASCGSDSVDTRFARSTGGADLLAASSDYDLSLLRIRGTLPAGLPLSGWSIEAIDHPASAYGVHHPRGEEKSYSAGSTQGNRLSLGVTNAIAVTWSEGTTEGGSSGSGLFLRNGNYLVGGLSHGPDCGPRITDHYGPFRDFFPQIARWLAPDDSVAPVADDHGNTPSEATLVGNPSSTAGNLERHGDRDSFRFQLATAGNLRVYTTGSTDTYGTLTRSSDSNFSHVDDDSGQDYNFQIRVSGASAGTYYIEVRGYTSETTGTYTLHVASTARYDSPDHVLPLILPVSDAGMESFVRIVNRTNRAGEVSIVAIDDSGRRFGPISLSLAPERTAHFNSTDLEQGNPAKGLGGVGNGTGNWRLELSTELDTEALAYIRTAGGFLTSIHEVAPESQGTPMRYELPFFNPASNRANVSWLRLANLTDDDATVTISARDDRGDPAPDGSVRLPLPARSARLLSAQQLEAGTAAGVQGRFGDGVGKWKLSVSADRSLHVMSLMRTASGDLTNLTR